MPVPLLWTLDQQRPGQPEVCLVILPLLYTLHQSLPGVWALHPYPRRQLERRLVVWLGTLPLLWTLHPWLLCQPQVKVSQSHLHQPKAKARPGQPMV